MRRLFYLSSILFLLLVGCGIDESVDNTAIDKEQDTEILLNADESDSDKSDETVTEDKEASAEMKTGDHKKLVPVELVSPIDGDTIKVNIDGKEENIRFLLIDTPETNHPRHGVQPFGPEAKEFTTNMVKSGQVQLEFDISHRDKYQRLLAYVYVDGVSVQEELLKNGLARVAYIYEPNTKYVDEYTALQKEAQQKAVGIWSVENYATDRGFDESVINPTEEKKETTTNGCDIKGNINRSGEKIYHMPDQQYYDVTNPEEMFCTEEEAVEAGFRKSKR